MLYHFDSAVDRAARVDAEKRTAYMRGHINQTKASQAGKSRIVKEGTQLRAQKSIMKYAVIPFSLMLFCMMSTHLYSKPLLEDFGFATIEILSLEHNFVSISDDGVNDKHLINGAGLLKISILKTKTDNLYVGGGVKILSGASGFLVSSNAENTNKIGVTNQESSYATFLSALYSVADRIYVKLDVDLIVLLGRGDIRFASDNIYVSGSNYFATAFANIGSPTLSFGLHPIGSGWGITIFCKYNHNAILNNYLHNKFYNKVLDAQKTLRDEYKQIISVDDINNLFKNANMSYFTIGISLGWGGKT